MNMIERTKLRRWKPWNLEKNDQVLLVFNNIIDTIGSWVASTIHMIRAQLSFVFMVSSPGIQLGFPQEEVLFRGVVYLGTYVLSISALVFWVLPRTDFVRNMVSNPKIQLGFPQEVFNRGVVYRRMCWTISALFFWVLPSARRSGFLLGPHRCSFVVCWTHPVVRGSGSLRAAVAFCASTVGYAPTTGDHIK